MAVLEREVLCGLAAKVGFEGGRHAFTHEPAVHTALGNAGLPALVCNVPIYTFARRFLVEETGRDERIPTNIAEPVLFIAPIN